MIIIGLFYRLNNPNPIGPGTTTNSNGYSHYKGTLNNTFQDITRGELGKWISNTSAKAAGKIADYLGLLDKSSSSGSGPGSSPASSSPTGFTVRNGQVQFVDPNFQYAMDMMNQQAMANNEWSAQQAQKQMDFQERMCSTAHQREVADLKAAGLNPVLSSGGSGASTPTGAMADLDTGNTRMIADLAMAALDAVQNTAVGVAGAGGSGKNGLLDNYYVKRVLSYGASELGRQIVRAAFY